MSVGVRVREREFKRKRERARERESERGERDKEREKEIASARLSHRIDTEGRDTCLYGYCCGASYFRTP